MKRPLAIILLLVLPILQTQAQQTIGLFKNTPESFDGYTLFAPIKSTTTYLINNCGEKVHSWPSQYQPNLSCYLLENGILLRTGKVPGPGGGSSIVEMIDWDGTVIWEYSMEATIGNPHHDIAPLPNGNILFIVSDERTQAELSQAGGTTQLSEIKSEQIIEVQPDLVNGGGTVVWIWKAWDHLIQDVNNTKDHFGTISAHPEKIDINFLDHKKADWLHINGIDYHPKFDQIIVSVHNFSEFWIIDHSTTTTEAASSSGGTFGKGGDLLYRWGNPQAYDQGDANDQKLFLQHHTHWIPESLPGGGKILLFNNQAGTSSGKDYSTVDVVTLPVDANGFYTYSGGSYAPADFDWTYQAPVPTEFYSSIISGVQRLENGNTLICEGVTGRFFEVDENSTTVWEYINPVNDQGAQAQETSITDNNTFRCARYAPFYPGLSGRGLTPQGYIESGSTFSCELYPTGIPEADLSSEGFRVYPNPANDKLNVETVFTGAYHVSLYNAKGQLVADSNLSPQDQSCVLEVGMLNTGFYYIVISGDSERWTERLLITK